MTTIDELMIIEDVIQAKKILMEACHRKCTLYLIDHVNSQPHQLTLGDLDKIRTSEKPVEITIMPGEYNHQTYRFKRLPRTQKVGIKDFWVERSQYEKLSNIGIPSPKAYAYRTPALNLLYKAIEEFWANFDETHPPKKEAILQRLKEQGATGRVAEAIDILIRPEEYRTGGNR